MNMIIRRQHHKVGCFQPRVRRLSAAWTTRIYVRVPSATYLAAAPASGKRHDARMIEGQHERDRWTFDGLNYLVTRFSDVATRDGYGWELEELGPFGARDSSGSLLGRHDAVVHVHGAHEGAAPFRLVEQFVAEASVVVRSSFDLDCSSLDEVRHRVVDPVVGCLLRSDELDRNDLRFGPPPGYQRISRLTTLRSGSYWASRTKNSRSGYAKATRDLWSAEVVADQLYSALSDWLPETGFAWGEQRQGDYVIPPAIPT